MAQWLRQGLARWLREPLLHFALLAAAVFALHQAFATGDGAPERVIRLSASEVTRLASLYAAEAGAAPGPLEMKRLLGDHVETRALAAEARRLGLDQGDAVVERRLAQKMRFTLSDVGEIAAPDEALLRAWVDANAERFARKPRYSFDLVFFKDPADPRLTAAKAALASGADWRGLGDPFMLSRQAGELPLREITRRFGPQFAKALAPLEPGAQWRGPVASAFGAHLIRLTAKSEAAAPPFDVVKEQALALWREEERRRRADKAVAELLARYAVIIEKDAP